MLKFALRFGPHVCAGGLALVYANFIRTKSYVTTGVQFVSPLAVIMVVHLVWLAARQRLVPGYSADVFRQALGTALGVAALTLLAAIEAPMPAAAGSVMDGVGNILGGIVWFLGCLLVLVIVVGVPALVIYLAGWGVLKLYQRLRGGPPGPPTTRVYDFGAVAVALFAIGTASLEGVPGAFSFAPADRAAASHFVAATPEQVWRQVARATSPAFPIPLMLQSIPRPVAIVLDEGAALGARRVVHFAGREGGGDLALQVVRRTATEAVFEVRSDGSPIAHWVRHKALTFRVEPAAGGTRLTVSLDYERLLAPAWFFRPYVRAAAWLAVDVLARDTKGRAEGG